MSPEHAAGPEIADNPAESRYEVRLDGRVVGFTEYEPRDGGIVFVHTEVDPEVEGRGIGSRLVAGALADARDRRLRIEATCPFVSAYLRRHPEALG